jgi:hypothetical protein
MALVLCYPILAPPNLPVHLVDDSVDGLALSGGVDTSHQALMLEMGDHLGAERRLPSLITLENETKLVEPAGAPFQPDQLLDGVLPHSLVEPAASHDADPGLRGAPHALIMRVRQRTGLLVSDGADDAVARAAPPGYQGREQRTDDDHHDADSDSQHGKDERGIEAR